MANKIKLGDYNRLRVVKKVDFGMYLDGGDEGEILLPTRYVPEGLSIGDEIDVFIYLDQEECKCCNHRCSDTMGCGDTRQQHEPQQAIRQE